MGVGAHDGRGCGAGTMRVKGMLAGAGRQGGVCSKGAWAAGSSGGILAGRCSAACGWMECSFSHGHLIGRDIVRRQFDAMGDWLLREPKRWVCRRFDEVCWNGHAREG